MYQPFVAVPSYESSEQRSALPWSGPDHVAPTRRVGETGASVADVTATAGATLGSPGRQRAGVIDPTRGTLGAPGRDAAGLDAPGLEPRGLDAPGLELPGLDVSGLGPLAPYAADPDVTDLFINGQSGLWVDAGRGPQHQPEWERSETDLRELAVRLIAVGGRHIDEASPCVDVRLADGIRVHAVLPPVSSTGTLLSIRLPRAERFSLAALTTAGMCGSGESALTLARRLRASIASRENFLITGAAGSGKTTLLSALLGEAAPSERIVAIEDVAELRINHPHVVALESRQANLEGAGRIGLETLVREALRMRPDRLVLGECRGAEIRELLAALNTGHDGGAGTLHANSLRDVPARLEALGALAGMNQDAVARQTVSAIQVVVHLERAGGVRRVAQIGRFTIDGQGRLGVEAA
jgi:pilus assembly protein CpaF